MSKLDERLPLSKCWHRINPRLLLTSGGRWTPGGSSDDVEDRGDDSGSGRVRPVETAEPDAGACTRCEVW
jgi:hypothetical protein